MKTKKSKSPKEETQKRLDEINLKEKDFLQSQMKTSTRNFWTRQSFGTASEIRHISPEEYLRYQ